MTTDKRSYNQIGYYAVNDGPPGDLDLALSRKTVDLILAAAYQCEKRTIGNIAQVLNIPRQKCSRLISIFNLRSEIKNLSKGPANIS